MATEEKILIDVQIKSGDAIGKSAELGVQIKKLRDEQAALNKALAENTISAEKFKQASGKLGAEIILLTNSKKALDTQVKNEVKQTTALQGSYDQLSASYNLNKQKLNDMTIAERAGTDAGKALEKETFQIYQEMIRLQEATGKHVLSVGDYTKVVSPLVEALKKENIVLAQNNQELEQQRINIIGFNQTSQQQDDQIKAINNQIGFNNQKMQENSVIIKQSTNNIQDLTNVTKVEGNTIAGMNQRLAELQKTLQTTDLGSKQFKEANEEAQKLKLKIDQTLGKVNEFGDKEPRNLTKKAFSDTAEAGAGLVSIVQLANVVLGENEKTSEAQAAVLKAVATSQLAMNAAKGIGAIMDVKELVVKGLLIAKEKLLGFVTDETTKKIKLQKAALAASGIGAIVLLLAELAFNFEGVNKKINQAINYLDDLGNKITNNNKLLKVIGATFLAVLAGPIAPLILIIKLIDDFGGTINQLQGFINGAFDAVVNFTDGIPVLGENIKMLQKGFNFLADTLKSLDGSTKKYKVDMADLQKQYDSFNEQIERNSKTLKDQINIEKSKGKNEKEVADLTRKLLQQTTNERQKSLDRAIEISNKLIKQNGKLTDDQQKLFNKVQDDFNQSVVDQTIFENEIRKEANAKAKERYKERLDIERNLQHELIQLRNGFIKDEFAKQKADLDEQLRVDKENNDLLIQENIKKFGEKSKIVIDLREKDKLLLEKYNNDVFALEVSQADKEIDLLAKKNETEAQIRREGFEQRIIDLNNAEKIETDFLQASFVNTGKTNDQKKNQEIQHNNDLLAIQLKFLQDKLALSKEFALKDGLIDSGEAAAINEISTAIAGVQEQIKKSEGTKVIDGLGLTQADMDMITAGAEAVKQILSSITAVVDANAANQIRAIDDRFKYEEAAIRNSTLSEEEKEAKIQALNKKSAEEKYKIEVEQFETNKAISIVNTIITTAQAVMAALANPTPFAGPILAAVAAATGAAQLGIIASQPPPPKPQFAAGVIGLRGAGTETSDSIDARLSRGESVITAKATKRFAPMLARMEMAVGNNPNYQLGNGRFAGGFIGDGGFVNRGINNDVNAMLNSEILSDAIVKGMANLKVIAKISDINRVQSENHTNTVTAKMI